MNYQGMNILLVEDSEINQFITKTFLQKLGFAVTIANHGKEALNKIVSKIFQAVIMDIQMPEMDGFESTSRIRAMGDKYFKNVPIFAFTASDVKNVKDQAILNGMNDVINKPIVAEELREKISQYVTDVNRRELFIDFQVYTDGDLEFKNELISLMINNIHELRQTILTGSQELFLSVSHKVKATITMLDDSELSGMMDEFRSLVKAQVTPTELSEKRLLLSGICSEIVESLAFELK
ncbi:hypothetical protein WSM22_22810 [Cytophagales bacterium WSM2-2]|nr:hypothetical protein WSM22_22810 [Cytophagales bacterium WSM2-2]